MRASLIITVGDRFFGEYVDLEAEREEFDEREFLGEKPSWEHFTRPVKAEGWPEISKLNGDHLIFGYVEALLQADDSPRNCLSIYARSGEPWIFEFRKDEK